jgi:hypothetical protein
MRSDADVEAVKACNRFAPFQVCTRVSTWLGAQRKRCRCEYPVIPDGPTLLDAPGVSGSTVASVAGGAPCSEPTEYGRGAKACLVQCGGYIHGIRIGVHTQPRSPTMLLVTEYSMNWRRFDRWTATGFASAFLLSLNGYCLLCDARPCNGRPPVLYGLQCGQSVIASPVQNAYSKEVRKRS